MIYAQALAITAYYVPGYVLVLCFLDFGHQSLELHKTYRFVPLLSSSAVSQCD